MLSLSLQGGFAKCYELTDVKTSKIYAGKIISKARISKSSQKEKVRIVCRYRNTFRFTVVVTSGWVKAIQKSTVVQEYLLPE